MVGHVNNYNKRRHKILNCPNEDDQFYHYPMLLRIVISHAQLNFLARALCIERKMKKEGTFPNS